MNAGKKRVFLSAEVRLGPPEGEAGDGSTSGEWDWKVLGLSADWMIG
jgi:hypothetical protein